MSSFMLCIHYILEDIPQIIITAYLWMRDITAYYYAMLAFEIPSWMDKDNFGYFSSFSGHLGTDNKQVKKHYI